MPYTLIKTQTNPNRFKVCLRDKPKECFSKKGLPLKRAKAQRTAIILSERGLRAPTTLT